MISSTSTSDTHSVLDDDRTQALIALSAQETQTDAPCPSDETLAAFIDGRLNADERNDVVSHLDACSSCYRKWLDISFMADQLSDETLLSDDQPAADGKCAVVRPFRQPFSGWRRPLAGLAMAACLVMIVWRLAIYQADTDRLIEKSFQSVLNKADYRKPDFPWERPVQSYGFTSQTIPTSARAFGAGLWFGRQYFFSSSDPMPEFLTPQWKAGNIKEAKWTDTRWAAYFRLGKWAAMLHTALLSDVELSHEFRRQQMKIMDVLLNNLTKTNEKEEDDVRLAKEKLDAVKAILETSNTDLNKKQRRKAASELNTMIEHFSPNYIPFLSKK